MSESRWFTPKDLTCFGRVLTFGSEGFGEVPAYKGLRL